jgi:hypothetical protein
MGSRSSLATQKIQGQLTPEASHSQLSILCHILNIIHVFILFLFPPQMYIMLNIRIVLVGLEIWTDRNPINIIGGAGDVLGNFVQWREKFLITRWRHDSAQLVL